LNRVLLDVSFYSKHKWKTNKSLIKELLSIHKQFRVSVCFYCVLFKYVYWLKQSWELLLFFSLVYTHIIYVKAIKRRKKDCGKTKLTDLLSGCVLWPAPKEWLRVTENEFRLNANSKRYHFLMTTPHTRIILGGGKDPLSIW